MSTGKVIKVNMTLQPAETRREEVVCGSVVWSDGHKGASLRIPLCIRAASMSPVLAYAKVDLQRKCKKDIYVSCSG